VKRDVVGPVETTFLMWLRSGLSGCWFASNVGAGAGGIALPLIERDLQLDLLESALDGYAKRGVPAIALFPWVTSESDLVSVIAALAKRPRWKCRIVEGLPIPRPCTALGISYVTLGGDDSSAMGFAPLPTMPVTRRAPVFGLGAWAGGYDNPFVGVRKGLSFLHMPQAGDKDLFRHRRALSERWTGDRIGDPNEPSRLYYSVAFCLSSACRRELDAAGCVAVAGHWSKAPVPAGG
jgi:hypothetical protein